MQKPVHERKLVSLVNPYRTRGEGTSVANAGRGTSGEDLVDVLNRRPESRKDRCSMGQVLNDGIDQLGTGTGELGACQPRGLDRLHHADQGREVFTGSGTFDMGQQVSHRAVGWKRPQCVAENLLHQELLREEFGSIHRENRSLELPGARDGSPVDPDSCYG